MKTLIIYDNEGYKIKEQQGQPSPRVPVGVPYIYEEIPEGKRLITPKIEGEIVPVVNVSVTPHEVILEDIPATEMDIMKRENADLITKQAMQDIELKQSKKDMGELMIKVAMLEMGGKI